MASPTCLLRAIASAWSWRRKYPIRDAARIATAVIAKHLENDTSEVSEVILVLFSKSDYEVYAGAG
jgi:O-acetyl-ADP-ribose deacetylase (regulator of RNase III)